MYKLIMAKLSTLEIVVLIKKRLSVVWDYFGILKGRKTQLFVGLVVVQLLRKR